MRPGIDHLIITLIVGNEAHVVVVGNLLNLLVTLLNEFCLLLRDDDIIEVERQTGLISHTITQVLNTIKELTSLSEAHMVDNIGNDVAEALLRDLLIDVAHLFGDDAIYNDTTDRGLNSVLIGLTVLVAVVNHHLHQGVQIALTLIVGDDSLLRSIERESLALGTRTDLRNIIETQHHIL